MYAVAKDLKISLLMTNWLVYHPASSLMLLRYRQSLRGCVGNHNIGMAGSMKSIFL
jgi:hypothetical protein